MLFMFIGSLSAQNLFLWINENPAFHFDDPETGEYVTSDDRIKDYLDEQNINYTADYYLPEDLSEYDAVLAFLGGFCIS